MTAAIYSLHINNTGPSVIDSNIAFHATLYINDSMVSDPQLYRYEWSDDIAAQSNETYGNLTTEFVKTYSRHQVNQTGNHSMLVRVFKKTGASWNWMDEPVADTSTYFMLTGKVKPVHRWSGFF